MNTNFYNSNNQIILAGETIEKIYFYADGSILGNVDDLKIMKYESETCKEDSYFGQPEKIVVNFEIKKALKLNLNRKDAFYMKNQDKKYFFEGSYNLYIHTSLVNFEFVGDVFTNEINHQKNYFELYRVSFPAAIFKTCEFERIACENYTLQDGEKFSSGYGPDKEHACVDTYEVSDTAFKRLKCPDRIGEKGIIKKWFEYKTLENQTFTIKRAKYSKMICDDYRSELENLSKKLKNAGFDFSFYDLEKLQSKGFQIIEKEV